MLIKESNIHKRGPVPGCVTRGVGPNARSLAQPYIIIYIYIYISMHIEIHTFIRVYMYKSAEQLEVCGGGAYIYIYIYT